MFYLYILLCSDNSYYVGQTDNLEKRIQDHNSSRYGGYTSNRLPVKMIYHKIFDTRSEVLAAEYKIKKWSRSKKESLINGKITGEIIFQSNAQES